MTNAIIKITTTEITIAITIIALLLALLSFSFFELSFFGKITDTGLAKYNINLLLRFYIF